MKKFTNKTLSVSRLNCNASHTSSYCIKKAYFMETREDGNNEEKPFESKTPFTYSLATLTGNYTMNQKDYTQSMTTVATISGDKGKNEVPAMDYWYYTSNCPDVCDSQCYCPCQTCITCPFRNQMRKKRDINKSNTMWSKLINMQASNGSAYNFDSKKIPTIPLPRWAQQILCLTELPFFILWVYFTYWVVIVCLTAKTSSRTVWLSAIVAGILVGIGLNANAYRYIMVPTPKGAIKHIRLKNTQSINLVVDWGMVIRFFMIPFGVSCLSGLTNSHRQDFLLVFPKDSTQLMTSILCPVAVVFFLFCCRLYVIWHHNVRWSFHVIFLNGTLVN